MYFFSTIGNSLYKLQQNTEDWSFKGQVLLHPPSPLDRDLATSSFGLVGVKEEGTYCNNKWRFINFNGEDVNWSLASTVCEMNGFSRVSSIMTKKEAEELYNVSFYHWMDWK